MELVDFGVVVPGLDAEQLLGAFVKDTRCVRIKYDLVQSK